LIVPNSPYFARASGQKGLHRQRRLDFVEPGTTVYMHAVFSDSAAEGRKPNVLLADALLARHAVREQLVLDLVVLELVEREAARREALEALGLLAFSVALAVARAAASASALARAAATVLRALDLQLRAPRVVRRLLLLHECVLALASS
jgi:8-oxo-dGTP pyrophosphatase MutT (NUDIX family)